MEQMAKSWQKKEITYLKRYGANKSPAELAERFETDPGEVEAKLEELEIPVKGRAGGQGGDPVLEVFSEGLEALHEGKWKKAAELFEQTVSESDQEDVSARARQYLGICRQRLEGTEDESEDDPFLRAVVLKNRGDLKEALEVAQEGADDEDRFAYLIASLHSLRKEGDKAEEALARAIELNPKNRIYAFHDPDFAYLRDHEEHAHLFEEG